MYHGEGDAVTAFVVSLNLKRRHLNESHRAMVGARLANLKDGQRADYIAGAQICAPVSQSDAAEQMQVSRRSVQNAEVVQRDGIPELEQSVWDNRVSVSAAADVALELPERKEASQNGREVWTVARAVDYYMEQITGADAEKVPGRISTAKAEGRIEAPPDGKGVYEDSVRSYVAKTRKKTRTP